MHEIKKYIDYFTRLIEIKFKKGHTSHKCSFLKQFNEDRLKIGVSNLKEVVYHLVSKSILGIVLVKIYRLYNSPFSNFFLQNHKTIFFFKRGRIFKPKYLKKSFSYLNTNYFLNT